MTSMRPVRRGRLVQAGQQPVGQREVAGVDDERSGRAVEAPSSTRGGLMSMSSQPALVPPADAFAARTSSNPPGRPGHGPPL